MIACGNGGAGMVLKGWHVFPLPLENLTAIPFKAPEALLRNPSAALLKTGAEETRAGPCSLQGWPAGVAAADGSESQAAFYRRVPISTKPPAPPLPVATDFLTPCLCFWHPACLSAFLFHAWFVQDLPAHYPPPFSLALPLPRPLSVSACVRVHTCM